MYPNREKTKKKLLNTLQIKFVRTSEKTDKKRTGHIQNRLKIENNTIL